MPVSEKHIQELKDILEKEHGREFTWEEAADAAHRLLGLAEICYEHAKVEHARAQRLKKEPKGFHLEGVGYTCFVCGNSCSNVETWYDKWGIKCLVCQKAIDRRIIPASCASKKESWYSKYDLESRFNIDRHAMKRFIKQGIVKPRIVPDAAGRPHTYLFLVKDNKDTLPPKNLTESHMVKETKEGKDWYHLEPWHRFVEDPHKALAGYKIMDHLVVTHGKENNKKHPNKKRKKATA